MGWFFSLEIPFLVDVVGVIGKILLLALMISCSMGFLESRTSMNVVSLKACRRSLRGEVSLETNLATLACWFMLEGSYFNSTKNSW